MNLVGLLFLLITHYLSGRGLLRLFNIRSGKVETVALSFIMGVAVASFVPFLLQLCYIAINITSVGCAIVLFTLLLNITSLKKINFRFKWPVLQLPFKLYEYPFIIVCGLIILLSVWLCYYVPINVRDALSGPELLAKYTVEEQTMLNSVFKVNLETTNNHLKPPYLTCLQIVYKLFVMPLCSMWLSVLSVSFNIWLYSLLRQRLHPLLAGFLLLMLIAMPEVFSYTHTILFDYSNMIFFFCGTYFLSRYASDKESSTFLFTCLCFGIATYIRTETLALVFMLLPLAIYYLHRSQLSKGRIALNAALFILIPAFFYMIWMNIYLTYYMPVEFHLGDHVNTNIQQADRLFSVLQQMTTDLIFSEQAITMFGYLNYLFLIIVVIDAVRFRQYTDEARIALYSIVAVYLGLAILGYMLPWVDVIYTIKRGLFKIFPLILLYLGNSPLLLQLSGKIKVWEDVQKTPAPAAAAQRKNITKTPAKHKK